jgi:ribosomal protein S18 acetylase RimI-like enzyme
VTQGPERPTAPATNDIVVERVIEVTGEVLEAVRRLYPQLTDGPIPTRAETARVLERGAVMLVARSERSIVGMATLVVARVLSGTTAHVEDVVVDARMRGFGIGERLMHELIAYARAEGADEVTLTSRPAREAANRLYQRLGFELGGTNYYSLDLDGVSESSA